MRQGGHASDSRPFLKATKLKSSQRFKVLILFCQNHPWCLAEIHRFFFLPCFIESLRASSQPSSNPALPGCQRMMPQGFLVNVTWHAESRQKCWFSGPWMILQVAEVTQIHQILGLFLANCQLAMLGISVVVSQKCSRLANQIVVHIRISLHHKPKQNIKQNLELKTTLPYFNQRVTFQVFLSPKITSWEFTNISRLKWPKSSTHCQLQRLQTWIW